MIYHKFINSGASRTVNEVTEEAATKQELKRQRNASKTTK